MIRPKHLLLTFFTGLFLAGATSLFSQTETVLHRFSVGKGDGASPSSGVVADSSGALYGVTETGGVSCSQNSVGCGVVYKLTPGTGGDWRETILHSFTSGTTDGGLPEGNLLIDSAAGVIYGTTAVGGANDAGTVYSLSPGNPWTETTIYNFRGPEGSSPNTGVTLRNGILYGAANGGKYGVGTIYRLRPPAAGGTWQEQTLYEFTFGSDGGYPFATPVFDSEGNLYGTTFNSPDGAGTVYRLSPPSSGTGAWTLTTLYPFTGGADGGNPSAVVFDNSGALYGTTQVGGANNFGVVFKLTPPAGGTGAWTESILYSFTGGTDGAVPWAGVVFDTAGNLYGTTGGGGDLSCAVGNGGGCGTVFELSPPTEPDGNWSESVLYAFEGGNDGYSPLVAPLLLNGNLYGTTDDGGGKNGDGIAYKVTP